MTLDEVLKRFPDAESSGGSWRARCPAHEDRNPSLSISQGDGGRVLLICRAGCRTENVCREAGLTMADLFPASTSTEMREPLGKGQYRRRETEQEDRPVYPTAEAALAILERGKGPPAGKWPYHDASGNVVGFVYRWNQPDGKKTFRPISQHADGWRVEGMPVPRPLYRLPELVEPGRVFVCEGEKAADAGRTLGLVTTTSSGGSPSAAKSDWSPLAGREVVILPDNDGPGRKYADEVAGMLTSLDPPADVRIVELPGLPEKGDLVDWLEGREGDPLEQLEALVRESEPVPAHALNFDRWEPFPVDALPEPICEFVRTGAKSIGCDPSYLALPLLSILGAAIGNSSRLALKRDWLVPPVIWTAIVGESGTAKSPAFSLVLKPIYEREAAANQRNQNLELEHQDALARYKKQLAEWEKRGKADEAPPRRPDEPRLERFVTQDTTVEASVPMLLANPRGLLLARDELAGWFGSFDKYAKGKSGTDSAHWLSMFDAGVLIVDRKFGTPKSIRVPQASVCVTGGIQPSVLHRAIGTEHRESGMASRFLLTCPPRKQREWTDCEIALSGLSGFSQVVNRLFELPVTNAPRVFRLSDGAADCFRAFFTRNNQEIQDLSGDLAAAWSKLEQYAGRIALVLHLVKWAASTGDPVDEVIPETMADAVRLVEWFKHETRRVYSILAESSEEREQRRLLDWICRRECSVTVREVQQGCRWLKAPGVAERMLTALVKSGAGHWEQSPAGQRGQPTRRFVPNQRLR